MSDRFPPEFRQQIVALYLGGQRTARELAEEFDLSPTTVSNWVRKARRDEDKHPVKEVRSDREEIAHLRRLLKQREEELETLGKALAFFARRADQQ